jgi:nucleoid-associated protein YgaU
MYEVTCFRCGHVAHLSPDAEHCAVCNENLSHLITPEYASRYFYDRAAELAAAGELTLALLEVERGLAYRASSELLLLAAIFAQRLGNFPQMRQFVATIPVDDPLRSEAEWLVRAQQTNHPGVIPGLRGAKPAPTSANRFPSTEPEEEYPAAAPLVSQRMGQHLNSAIYTVIALALVGLVAWIGMDPMSTLLTALFPASANSDLTLADSAVTPTAPASAGNTPLGAPQLITETQLAPEEPVANEAQPTPTLFSPTHTPTPPPFDFKGFLAQTNRPELAELSVSAVLEGGILRLSGAVALYDQRQGLIELGQRALGVSQVDASALVIQTPEEYVVQNGDSLWLISYKLYGEDRVAELFAANQDRLASPEDVRPGQVLRVPQKQ